MQTVLPLLAAVVGYLIGSLSFAVIVSRAMGLNDPRTYGSGNPGATNVLRSGNKVAAALTLLLDALKGWLPVWWVTQQGLAWGLGDGTVALVAIVATLQSFLAITGICVACKLYGIVVWFENRRLPAGSPKIARQKIRMR